MSDKMAAGVALVLFVIGGGVTFGWRLWWQRRRTGSTGYTGIGRHPGFAEWCVGIGLVVAMFITFAAPVLQLAGVVEPLPFLRTAGIQVAGIAIAAVGIIGTAYSQLAMGDSWRVGVDEGETTTLVRSGVFGIVRNPIYVGMFVLWLGTTLITPNDVAIAGYGLLVVSIECQVRLVEEPYLKRAHGESYRGYGSTVGRFAPGVGLIR
jgi:protein-S-isoprenylcysteine O-methyltransferase Ste14